MGEAKRKRAHGVMLEVIRDEFFDMLSRPAQKGVPLNRAQLLGLLIEKAFLLDGFEEDEQNQLIELMEEVDRRMDEANADAQPTFKPVGDAVQQVIDRLPPPPAPSAKQPIDPERMAEIEARVREIAAKVGEMAGRLGFILLLFEPGDRPEPSYVANCDREDCINVLCEFLPVLAEGRDFPPDTLSRRPN